MSKDKELLEYAANAAGYELQQGYGEPPEHCLLINAPGFDGGCVYWNPLLDDGDALRLAVKLNLMVDCDTSNGMAQVAIPPHWLREPIGSDPYAATRRAIVRAAAEIGKSMK